MMIRGNPWVGSSNKPVIVALVLALLSLVTYLPALDNGFVNFDDSLYVTNTPWIGEGLTTQGVAWAFSHFYASNWHPITVVSHMVDREVFGLQPRGHHLTSVLLHTANVVLLFVLLWRMTGSIWRSALVAAFFAVHPLRVESVAWVSGRKDLLSTFFALLSVGAYLGWVRRRSAAIYALMLVWFSLALMAKAMVVTLPCVLLLLDVWPLRRLELENLKWRPVFSLIMEKLPLVLLALGTGIATILAQTVTMAVSTAVPASLRLSNAITAYAAYLRKTFVPVDLVAYYPFPAQIEVWKVAGALALLLAVTLLSLSTVRRAPYFSVGWFWFIGTLLPVIGLLKVGDQAMADRYTYLPSIGLALAVTWGIYGVLGERFRSMLTVLAVAATVSLAILTRLQIGYWSDSTRLFQHTLAVTGENYFAEYNLGRALLDGGGDRRESEAHFRAAVALRPNLAQLHSGFGRALRIWDKPEEALLHMEIALRLGQNELPIRHDIAMNLDALGREEEAMEHLRAILEVDPFQVSALGALADLLSRRGEDEAALEHCLAALRIVPDLIDLRLMTAKILDRLGRTEEAVIELGTVLEQQPDSVEAAQRLKMIRDLQKDNSSLPASEN